jgi:ABC-2 type transport system permease protein
MPITLRIRNNFSDMVVIAGRCLRHAFRSIDTIITVVAMPVLMMLMFVYVFGGAIHTEGVNYINYVVPGIVLMCIATGAPYTSLRLSTDITTGIVDRFRSMPIAKSSILTGHVLTSVAFNMFSSVIVMLFALLIGFRSGAGITEWLLVIGILLLFTLALTWLSVVFSLLSKSAEGAVLFSYPILILLFVSSAFTPTDSMHGALRVFAENQPMTLIIGALRSLLLNQPAGSNAAVAVLWCTGILVVSYIAAMILYKRKTA